MPDRLGTVGGICVARTASDCEDGRLIGRPRLYVQAVHVRRNRDRAECRPTDIEDHDLDGMIEPVDVDGSDAIAARGEHISVGVGGVGVCCISLASDPGDIPACDEAEVRACVGRGFHAGDLSADAWSVDDEHVLPVRVSFERIAIRFRQRPKNLPLARRRIHRVQVEGAAIVGPRLALSDRPGAPSGPAGVEVAGLAIGSVAVARSDACGEGGGGTTDDKRTRPEPTATAPPNSAAINAAAASRARLRRLRIAVAERGDPAALPAPRHSGRVGARPPVEFVPIAFARRSTSFQSSGTGRRSSDANRSRRSSILVTQ